MWQYQNLIADIVSHGETREDRTGIGTKALFNKHLTFKMDGMYFPVITLKETKYKGPLGELAAFLRGFTDNNELKRFGCNYWEYNLNADYWKNSPYKRFDTDLGKLGYSHTLRNFEGIDQLTTVMKEAWDNPYGRRHLVSHWNPKDMKESVLPPCHYAWQFYIHGTDLEYVSLLWNQRSVDVMLGLPADFVYYGALLVAIANSLGKMPYEVSCNLGDTHIYMNHLEAASDLWMKGTVYEAPKYRFKGMAYQAVEDFEPEHIEITDYKHGPFIPLKMAV